jgi:hypothetical protein
VDWTQAIAISQSLGFVFAMAARFVPFIPTKITPKVGIITIFLTNVMMLWSKFVESAGVATVAILGPDPHSGVALAGFGWLAVLLKPIIVIAQPALLSAAQFAINRWFHEFGIKAVISPTGVPVK